MLSLSQPRRRQLNLIFLEPSVWVGFDAHTPKTSDNV